MALHRIRALVSSGPTFEPIDPVRYLANRSSGKQGHAIASALAAAGAEVTLVSGPVRLTDPEGVRVLHVTTAEEMYRACMNTLPVDVAVMAAAVADWRVARMSQEKIKKNGQGAPVLELVENPDILRAIGHSETRPRLVVGFAAETSDVLARAEEKRRRKGADWIVANDVSEGRAFDQDGNQVTIVDALGTEAWPALSKAAIAEKLVQRITDFLKESS